jgi:hypothetical protein
LSNLASLNTLTMGSLSRVSSGITITGNPKLKALGFAELEEVDGLLDLTGPFTRYDRCTRHISLPERS